MISYHHQSKSSRKSLQARTCSRIIRSYKKLLWLAFALLVIIGVVRYFYDESQPYTLERESKFIVGFNRKKITYDRDMPLIFIGGVPRSGTTLMRAMLDAHPEVRCGQETRVVPRMLQFYANWLKSEKEAERLEEAGVGKEVLEGAVAQFCLEVIANHGYAAPRLCNKDPLTLKYGLILRDMFPNIKFLFMIRDGRASVHSMITRKVTVSNFDLNDYRQCLKKWNQMIKSMFAQCELLGSQKCMMVHYEKLVLYPEEMSRKILEFLDIPWSENLLHHEDFVNKTDGIQLSKVERSTDQVIRAINLEALSKWVGQIPGDVVNDMDTIAPMLGILGYDATANPPDYEKSKFKIDYVKLKSFKFTDKED